MFKNVVFYKNSINITIKEVTMEVTRKQVEKQLKTEVKDICKRIVVKNLEFVDRDEPGKGRMQYHFVIIRAKKRTKR